jgi:hypothetical protein
LELFVCTISSGFPRTTTCVTPTVCLVKAAAEFAEAGRVMNQAFANLDQEARRSVLTVYLSFGLPALETLDPSYVPAAIAKAVNTLAALACQLD